MSELNENFASDISQNYVDLESLRSTIKVELNNSLTFENLGFSDIISSVVNYFSDGFKAFSNFFNKSDIILSRNQPLPHFSKCEKSLKMVNDIIKQPGDLYGKVMDFKVPYLQGCVMQLDDLTNRLASLAPNHREIIMGYLNELDTIVSKLVSNADYLSGNREEELSEKGKEARDFVDKVKGLNEELFDRRSDKTDIRPISQVIPNITSLGIIRDNLKELYNYADRDFLPKSISIANSIHLKLKHINKDSKISKNNLKGVSERLLLGAESLTYLGTYYYLITQSILSFDALIKTIDENR